MVQLGSLLQFQLVFGKASGPYSVLAFWLNFNIVFHLVFGSYVQSDGHPALLTIPARLFVFLMTLHGEKLKVGLISMPSRSYPANVLVIGRGGGNKKTKPNISLYLFLLSVHSPDLDNTNIIRLTNYHGFRGFVVPKMEFLSKTYFCALKSLQKHV